MAVVASATTALAQAPTVPESDFGGGTIPKVGKGPYSAGSMVISFRTLSDGEVLIDAWLGERCEILEITTGAELGPDGSFSVSGNGRRNQRDRHGVGEDQDHDTNAPHSEVQVRTVQWAARRPTGVIGTPGSTPPAARLYGTTSQILGDDVSAGIVMRFNGDATKLTRAIYSEHLDCHDGFSSGLDSPATRVPIGADGTINDVERIDRKLDRRTRAISLERFKGTLGSAGASGTLLIKVRYIDLPTGDVMRCSSGTVKWTASL